MDDYLVEFDDYKEFTVGEFIEILKRKKGRHLNDLKVKDLTYFNNQLITPGHGVYIFKEDDAIILVGKARNVSFTERIAKHLDIRPNAWFNRLLYVKSREMLGLQFDDRALRANTYLDASKYAFENYSLILVNMPETGKIDKFESILRGSANPLNKFIRKTYSKDIVLKEI